VEDRGVEPLTSTMPL